MPQSSHLGGGERKDAFPCPSPTITHKHFRAMQGRKPCLAISPTPFETFPHSSSLSCSLQEESCISALKPYWDQTGKHPRQPGGLGSCEARTDLLFCPSVSGGWAEAMTHYLLTPTLPIWCGGLAGPRASKCCTLCVFSLQLLELNPNLHRPTHPPTWVQPFDAQGIIRANS